MMLAWLLSAALAAPFGWRMDGTGTAPTATPPSSWSLTEHVCWKAKLPSWGNATPVVVGERVAVLSEPTTLTVHDARDGRELWRAALDVTLAFEGDARAELAARLARADADEAELKASRAQYSALQREVRRSGGDVALTQQLQDLGKKLAAIEARLAGTAPYRTTEDLTIIGYATPTPVSDGQRLYVLTGHGVLAAFGLDGKRLWTRWLGPPVRPMRGFDRGHAASPQLVAGTLVVPYGHLRGVDPATGRDRWVSDRPWADYGTPAVRTIGSVGVIATPEGRLIRAKDGVTIASGFPSIFNVGPAVEGDVVTWFGNTEAYGKGASAAAVRLVPSGDTVKAVTLWTTRLDQVGLIAGSPVVSGGVLWAVEAGGEVWAVDDRSGKVLGHAHVGDRNVNSVHPSPTVVGDRLFVFNHMGRADVLRVKPDGTFATLATNTIEPSRSTPWFQGRRIYVRGERTLWCFE